MSRRSTTHTHVCAFLFTTLAMLCATSSAIAIEGQSWLGAGTSTHQPGRVYRQFGGGAQLGTALHLGERWGIQAGADALWYAAAKQSEQSASFLLTDAYAGVRYNLDYFQYIPYLALNAVFFLPDPIPTGDPDQGSSTTAFGTRLSLGLTWRPRRTWSLGGQLDLTGSLPNFGLNSALWLQVGYHWRL